MDVNTITSLFNSSNNDKIIKIEALDEKYNHLKLTYEDIVSEKIRNIGKIYISFEFNFDMDSFLQIYKKKYPEKEKQEDKIIKDKILDDFKNYFFIFGKIIFSHDYQLLADKIHDKEGTIAATKFRF